MQAAVGDVFAVIPDGSAVYYTFSETLSADEIAAHIGDDPETSWVEVSRATPKVGDNPADTITGRHTVRLVTVMGAEHSDVNWYYLGVQPEAVSFEPPFGVKTTPSVAVEMDTATVGAEIWYTTDGSDPRSSPTAQPYDDAAPPVFADDVSIRAAALYDGVWSEVTSTWYVFETKDDFGVTPFYPPGVYEGPVTVTLTAQNPDYEIFYSPDGVTWTPYVDPLEIDRDADVYAKTRDPKTGEESAVYGPFRYTIRPEPPVFAPTSTQFSNADEITVFCGDDRTDTNGDRFLLYYTTDGSDPTTSPTRVQADAGSDSAVIPITKYTVVKAAVLRDGEIWSSVVTNAYDVVTGKATAPLTTLPPGYYTLEPEQPPYTTQFVPVPTGTTIYYTTDGSTPDVNDPSQAYTPGTDIPIHGHEIIKAVAVNALGYKSDVALFDYTVTPAAPKAAPSTVVGSDTLPLVPVVAVEDAVVTYTVNDVPWSFVNDGDTVFYQSDKKERQYDCALTLPDESELSDLRDDRSHGIGVHGSVGHHGVAAAAVRPDGGADRAVVALEGDVAAVHRFCFYLGVAVVVAADVRGSRLLADEQAVFAAVREDDLDHAAVDDLYGLFSVAFYAFGRGQRKADCLRSGVNRIVIPNRAGDLNAALLIERPVR